MLFAMFLTHVDGGETLGIFALIGILRDLLVNSRRTLPPLTTVGILILLHLRKWSAV